MGKRNGERARWLWAAWAFTAGGCATQVVQEPSDHVVEGGSGGSGVGGAASGDGETGGAAGAGGTGGEGGGSECTPGGSERADRTCIEGKCLGECAAEQLRCAGDRPQRCNEHGQWEDAAPCGAAAPVCSAGRCVPPSCVGLAEVCGPAGGESCCATAQAVPGGTFNRSNDPKYPATVSSFLLDRFEVTVGRFRKFVEAYPGSKPGAGAGAHPSIEGSGWDADWTISLPAGVPELMASVNCDATLQTWTDEAGANEQLPMNCLTWEVAFAFCAWDGGRLPTEAEWNYAAAGGREQREYPWSTPASSTTIDGSHAVYGCAGDGSTSSSCTFSDIQVVGSRSPKGDGKWGHADLSGNLGEWVLDWYATPYWPGECNDCANLVVASYQVFRGGGWNRDASALLSSRRDAGQRRLPGSYVGARCARTP
ncbi:formylglycine-generating enzyme family protein [Sorangium sp. So ce1024]|uniref:formylglycine-generating enzyme family protein n=1 Tax=unclassified Sorangium TaxID=2621164 RepID=UPI003F11BD89